MFLEKVREGIAVAKAKGVYTGRKPTLSPEDVGRLKELIGMGVSKAKAARDFKISRETVYQYLRNS
jgi:DNA invertase Pin-like site-specific DNA recombinase